MNAALRDRREWVAHPQGAALQTEPLVHREQFPAAEVVGVGSTSRRPLAGVRVLDLRVCWAAGEFRIHHGSVLCGSLDDPSQHITTNNN